MNAKRILDVVRQSGDQNLGQTLLRLARLAQENHRFEIAADLSKRAHEDARHSTTATDICGRIDGATPRETRHDCTDAAAMARQAPRSSSVCTEANR